MYACWHCLLVCLLARFACMLAGTVCLYACWHCWGPCICVIIPPRHLKGGTVCLYACWHCLLVCLLAQFACMLAGTACLYACWHCLLVCLLALHHIIPQHPLKPQGGRSRKCKLQNLVAIHSQLGGGASGCRPAGWPEHPRESDPRSKRFS